MFSLGIILFVKFFRFFPGKNSLCGDPLYEALMSGEIQEAEKFFQGYQQKQNEAGLIPSTLKILLINLLNKDPE